MAFKSYQTRQPTYSDSPPDTTLSVPFRT